jgi:hypothetical protein
VSAVEQAYELEARSEKLRLKTEALTDAERVAFRKFGKGVEALYKTWLSDVAPAIKDVHEHWVDDIRPAGGAQHATVAVPRTFGAMFRLFYFSALERDYVRHTFADSFIDSLAPHDERIDVSGDGMSEAPGI